MNERDGYIVEMALDVGFTMTNDDGDEYACTEAQLLEFWRRSTRRIETLEAELHSYFHRIEELQAALRLYACDCKPDDGCGVEYYDGGANCGRTARKALEGKDD